jgi:hypothetical protein
MATSETVDFNLSMSEIIEEAYERCGLELRTGYDSKTARRSLNLLFSEWANRGLNLWVVEEVTQNMAQLSTTSAITDYPLGTITLTVAASGGFSIGETITGSVSGATAKVITKPTATTMTLTVPVGTFVVTPAADNVTGSTSGAVTSVTAVPSLSDTQATVDILEAVIRRDGSDIAIGRISRGDYLAIPDKTSQGRPTQFYIDRLITPTITVWPAPTNSTDQLIYYRVKRIQDVGTAQNNPDVPFRFLPCLVAGLSYYLAVKRSPQRIGMLKQMYDEEWQRAASEDSERVALRLVPTQQSLRI